MGDEELRNLERLARAGDGDAVVRWAQAQLFRSLAFLHASMQRRLAETPARSSATAAAASSGLAVAAQAR